MVSPFEDVFSCVSDTLDQVFGTDAIYTVAADSSTIEVPIRITRRDEMTQSHGDSRQLTRMLSGYIAKALVSRPAKGDSIVLEDDEDETVYQLTQTPVESRDGLQWLVEFASVVPVSRGGASMFPMV